MIQDGLKIKVHSVEKLNSRWPVFRETVDQHLNSIRMWYSLESWCFSFWAGQIDTAILFYPTGWCTSTDLVVTSLLHYILKIVSILYFPFFILHSKPEIYFRHCFLIVLKASFQLNNFLTKNKFIWSKTVFHVIYRLLHIMKCYVS